MNIVVSALYAYMFILQLKHVLYTYNIPNSKYYVHARWVYTGNIIGHIEYYTQW